MKKFFLLFVFGIISITIFSQPYYSKVTTPSQFLSSFGLENMITKNDTIIFNSYPVEEVGGEFYANTYLTKYLNDGQLISATKLGIQSKRSRILLDDKIILTLGTFKESTRDSLQILLMDGSEAFPKLEIYNPYGYLSLGSHYNFLKYKSQYLVFCSGEYFYLNKSKEYKPYIIYINNDFTLDTVIQLDLPYGELFDYGIDDNGHLNILAQYHSDRQIAGPNMTKNYQGYIKLDESKKITHSYFEEQKDWRFPYTKRPSGVFYPDGAKVFTYTLGIGIGEIKIRTLDRNDKNIWIDSTYHDQQYANNLHGNFTRCKNDDVLVLAENIHQSLLSSQENRLRTSVIQRFDKSGKEKFYRSYGYYTVNESQSAGNWLSETKEIGPNNIIAIGGISKSPQDMHALYPGQISNDSTWILSIDSIGCIDKNKCNDVIAWNAPDNLYQYDQINVRHKEWYFSNDKWQFVQSFGRDTNMFDQKYSWIRYRPIITKNLDTGAETKDTVLATWTREGRMYISGIKKCFDCSGPIYPLYDFTLSLHDTFTLPFDYGKVIVAQVDSVSLIPGYLRKRIILQHLNPTNQTKYGDLVWIEGIGSPNGILYYNDWKQGNKTELTCYYDRGEKRYSSTNDPDCRKPVLVKPEFTSYGPYCVGSIADVLPAKSINTSAISGKWIPDLINTTSVGTFQYIFTPDEGQNADTTSILVQIIDKITPEFNIKTNYSINDLPENLPNVSFNGVVGTWSPSIIDTKILGSTSYTFYPNESSCALTFNININVSILTDTTEMDRSSIWYSSSYTGSWAEGDCRKKIDITKVVRDTIIGDRLCRIIGVTTDGIYLPESEIAMYSKDGKMYFYEDDTWKLLYDFTADIGDTVTYYISKKYPYYESIALPLSFDQTLINDNPYQLVVKEIDSIYDNTSKPIKRFLTENIYNIHGHFMGFIMPNIGSRAKLFGNNVIIVPPQCNPAEEGTGLRCYSDDEVSIKFTDGECDKLVSVTDIQLSGITIYPNPGMTVLNMKKDNEKDFFFTITNVAGQILTSGQVDNQLEISTIDWTSGMYFINISDNHGKRFVQKWVKM